MECWIIGVLEKHPDSITPLLHCSNLQHRVTPDECGLTSSDGNPGTNGATSKTRCGTGMNTGARPLQAGFVSQTPSAVVTALSRRAADASTERRGYSYPSTISSGSSFADGSVFGKWPANNSPADSIPSTNAWVNSSRRKWSRIFSTSFCQNFSPHFW